MSYEQISRQVKEQVSNQAKTVYEDYKKIKGFKDVGYLLENYVVSGGEVTKNLFRNDAIDITDIVVSLDNNILSRDGQTFSVSVPNTTYFLDFTKYGDWHWGLSHNGVAGADYLPVASVGTNSSGLVNTIVDLRGHVGGTRFKDDFGLEDYAKQQYVDEQIDDVNAQLADISHEVIEGLASNQYALNEMRKKTEETTPRIKKLDNFSSGLNEWSTTPGIEISSEALAMVSGTNTHTNVALYKGIKDVRGIEAIVGAGGKPQYARLVFGSDMQNWMFTSPSLTENVAFYRVVAGVVDLFQNQPFNQTPVTGDRIKAVLHGQNIQYFINDVLLGTMSVTSSYPYLLPPRTDLMAGVAFRTAADTWNVDEVKIYPNRPHKYMHFSVDDVMGMLKALNTNAASYNSIFDDPKFAFLKDMHNKYGLVVSLYCFYSDAAGWNLDNMTTKFASEFRNNASWLKLAFHGHDTSSRYDGVTNTAADALNHYNLVVNAIKTFASGYNLDTITRLSFFAGDRATCQALRDAEFKTKGFLTADDTRTTVYYLNETQRDTMQKCDDYYDATEKLYFIKTDLRIESFADPLAELKSRVGNIAYAGQNDILTIFTHDAGGWNSNQSKMESVFKWAAEQGYIFASPGQFIPEC